MLPIDILCYRVERGVVSLAAYNGYEELGFGFGEKA